MNTQIQIDRTGNRYCGPLVIAAVLGVSTAEAAAEVRRHTGGYAVRGLSPGRLLATLAGNGKRIIEHHVPRSFVKVFGRQMCKGPTLAAWLRSRTPEQMKQPFIIFVTGHYVLVKGRKFVDTFTKGEWVFIRSAPHRRCRVNRVWEIAS
jgi:hypothetical protein